MDLPDPVGSVLEALPSLRTVVVGAVVTLGLIALLATVLVATGIIAQPTVEGVDTEWGNATNETTQIETQAHIKNPNPVGIPGLITIEYTASLNDVVLAEGKKAGVGPSPGESTVAFSTAMDNDRIADWWVTHVNNDERSTLTIEPSVSGPGASESLPEQTSTVETDLLSSLSNGTDGTVALDSEPLLTIGDWDAAWGTATAETTPLTLTTDLSSDHNRSISLTGVEYVVTMNDVTLGAGQTSDSITLTPNESETLAVDTDLDTAAFAEWWPTHVRNGETSQMRVELYGLVERDGNRTRVPIQLYQQRLQFQTDLLGDNGTSVESLPSTRDTIAVPTVDGIERRWGTITDETTDIHADMTVDNTNTDPEMNDFVRLAMATETSINGVFVGAGSHETGLESGTSEVRVSSRLDNAKVPTWWARHLNRDETSTVESVTTTTADIGFTTVDVPTEDANSTTETDLLAEMNTDDPQSIDSDGQTYFIAESTTVEWGQATTQVAPLDAQSSLRNQQPGPITIQEIDYDVSIGDVTLANGSQPDGTTIGPGERGTIDLQIDLNNSRMDEWWVSHVRNGEQSTLAVDVTATIEVGDETRTVPLSMFSTNETVETDLLG